MKNFFTGIVDIVVTAVLKVGDSLKSFHIRTVAANLVCGVKSFFSSSEAYDDSGRNKKIILVGSVAVILVAIACTKLFWPSRSDGGNRISLTAPTRQDANGNTWSLQLLKGQSPQIIAQVGVEPGPPLLVKPEVAVRGRIVVVGVTVQGQAGEKYVPGVQRNAKWLPPPRFRLIGENGQVLAKGQFEYG